MKNTLILTIFFVGLATTTMAQTIQKDSVLKSLGDSTVAYLHNADKATFFIELRKKRSKEILAWFHYLDAHSDKVGMFLGLNKLDSAYYHLKVYERLIDDYREKLSLEDLNYLEDYIKVHKFNFYRAQYRYSEAIDILVRNIEKINSQSILTTNHLKQLFFDYHSLSFIFNAIGSYKKAADYEEKAIAIFERFGAESYAYKILPLTTLAHLYGQLGDTVKKNLFYEKAHRSYELARKSDPKNTGLERNALNLLKKLFEQAIDIKDFQKAENYVQQIQLLNERDHFINYSADLLNGIIALKKQELAFAKLLFKQALKECDSMSINKGEIFLNLAKVSQCQLQSDSALFNVQNAIIAVSRPFNNTDFKTNPPVSEVLSKKVFFEILNLKTDILLKLSTNNSETYLIPAFETAQLGIKLIDSIRVDYTANFDKANLIATAYPIFEKFINASYLLYKKTRDTSYILAAYQAVEQSKALLLLEGLKGVEAETVLSETDRNLLFQLRGELTSLEKKRNDEKNQNIDNVNYRNIQAQIFDKNRQFDALIKTFETRYPAYFKLKFDRQLSSIKQMQTLLKTPQTLVEYFVGDSSLFVFIVKANHYELKEIKKDFPLEEWVKLLRGSLNAHNFQFQADVYADMASRLYVKLIQPFKAQLTEEIILIPDGILGYIPFEALLTKAPEKAFRFQTHAYLLRDHSISYSFSATLLREMMQKKHQIEPSKTVITYAPFFNGDTTKLDSIFANNVAMRGGFAPLSNSGEEAFGIAKIMNGEAIIGENATENTFIKTAQSARILHLATHGKADDKSGDYSYLAFTRPKDSTDYALLYVRDLYNLTLNADMVVLSACETGIGKLQRGEGIISLARAFAYAGAKSIVTSLWSVNDAKTKDLMLFFYKNVKKGLSKDAALRAAKLSLIAKKDNPNAHPFFWAGFIGIGDMSKIR